MNHDTHYVDSRTPEERANEPSSTLTTSSDTPTSWAAQLSNILAPLYDPSHTHVNVRIVAERLSRLMDSVEEDAIWRERERIAKLLEAKISEKEMPPDIASMELEVGTVWNIARKKHNIDILDLLASLRTKTEPKP